MARFSQRHGYSPLPEQMHPEAMTRELRSSLWNAISAYVDYDHYDSFTYWIWGRVWRKPIDERPFRHSPRGEDYSQAWSQVKGDFFECKWYVLYDYIEETLAWLERIGEEDARKGLIGALNHVLETELAAYRVIDGLITPITSSVEIEEVGAALSHSGRFRVVSTHIETALACLSAKPVPDLRNCIKEAMSAVESAAKLIVGDSTDALGTALAKLEKDGRIKGIQRSAFKSLYGYTSDQGGIRHGLMEESSLTVHDAQFFLVACSAFANYLVSFGK